MAEQTTIKIANGIDMDMLQETVSAIEKEPTLAKSRFRIRNKWIKGGHNRTTVGDFYAGGQRKFLPAKTTRPTRSSIC